MSHYRLSDPDDVRFDVIGDWTDAWSRFVEMTWRSERSGSFEIRRVSADGLATPLLASLWITRPSERFSDPDSADRFDSRCICEVNDNGTLFTVVGCPDPLHDALARNMSTANEKIDYYTSGGILVERRTTDRTSGQHDVCGPECARQEGE